MLYDEVIGHLVETVQLRDPDTMEMIERRWADGPREDYQPYAETADHIPVMARPGDGYRVHTTGLTHAENGFPTQSPEKVEQVMQRLLGKLERHRRGD